jgi:hypothetical protein
MGSGRGIFLCHRPELPRSLSLGSDGNPRAASSTAENQKSPKRDEREAALGGVDRMGGNMPLP